MGTTKFFNFDNFVTCEPGWVAWKLHVIPVDVDWNISSLEAKSHHHHHFHWCVYQMKHLNLLLLTFLMLPLSCHTLQSHRNTHAIQFVWTIDVIFGAWIWPEGCFAVYCGGSYMYINKATFKSSFELRYKEMSKIVKKRESGKQCGKTKLHWQHV